MRILYITPSFQHPSLRGPTRHYHFIRELSRRHQITLLALTRTAISPEAMQEMTAYTERILTFDANGTSGSTMAKAAGNVPIFGDRVQKMLQLREGVKQMKSAFMQLVRQEPFDLVLFHGKALFPVIENCNGLPIVVDFCDATSMRVLTSMRRARLLLRLGLFLRYLQVRHIEKRLIRKTPHVAFISFRDRSAVVNGATSGKIIPIGVDLAYWTRKASHPQGNRLLFTGVMDYQPNADAAFYLIEKILPRVRQTIPDVELFIVGRNPSPALQEMAQRHPRVTVTGFVDDMRPYFERATVYVAPVRIASGVQNKALEALAMELPVVTTRAVYEGLIVDHDPEPPVCVADTDEQFAEHVVKLLRSQAERSRLIAPARRYVERHFDWSRNAQFLEEMCLAAVASNGKN